MKHKFTAAADGGALEIFIYGRIGQSYWDDTCVSAAGIAALLREYPTAKLINIRINSLGGSVFEGSAIYNQLVRHPAHKIVDIDGVAASAASWIVMAGHERRMGLNGYFMIHEASGDAWGPASELEKTAALLRKMNEQQLDVYAQHSSLSRDELREAVAAETWYTAQEALAAKFLTSTAAITPPLLDDETALAKMPGTLDAYGFKRAPEGVERFFSFGGERPRVPVFTYDTVVAPTAEDGARVAEAMAAAGMGTNQPFFTLNAGPSPRATDPVTAVPQPTPPPAVAVVNPTSIKGDNMKLTAAIMALLGLQEDADQAAIEAAIVRACDKPLTASETVMKTIGAQSDQGALDRVRELQTFSASLLGLTGASTHAQVMATISGWQASANQNGKLVQEVAQLQKQLVDTKRDALIKTLSVEGKLPPAAHDWARTQTAEQLEVFAAAFPKGVLAERVEEPEGENDSTTLTATDRQAAKALGMSEAKFLEAKKREAQAKKDRRAA